MRHIPLHTTAAVLQLVSTDSADHGCVYSDRIECVHNGKRIALIKMNYGADNSMPSIELLMFNEGEILDLPRVIGTQHFLSCVIHSVLTELTAEQTSYHEVFQDEDGNGIAIPLLVLGFLD